MFTCLLCACAGVFVGATVAASVLCWYFASRWPPPAVPWKEKPPPEEEGEDGER